MTPLYSIYISLNEKTNKKVSILFKNKIKYLLLIVAFLMMQSIVAQYQIPEKPKFQTSVYDYVKLLSSKEKTALENKLIKYSDSTSTQIVIAIIKSTKGENIAYLGAQWLTKWGIGDAKKDNGILITLAKDDRKININTGYGVEHLLTDFTSRQIIEYTILPEFKKGGFYKGLDKGTDAIFKVINGEYQGTRKQSDEFDPTFIIMIIIFIVFFILISRGNRNNHRGGKHYRKRTIATDIFETIILSNSGRGGFGSSSSGSFGSGGFGGGFGGGMGGGGGATGSW